MSKLFDEASSSRTPRRQQAEPIFQLNEPIVRNFFPGHGTIKAASICYRKRSFFNQIL
jgi:hypothetical protein